MIWLLIGLWSMAGPAEEAHDAMVAFGPHVATYVKESTGEPRLEVHFSGSHQAVFKVTSSERVALLSVDDSRIRIADGKTGCANVDLKSMFDAAKALSLGLDNDEYSGKLIYESMGGGNLNLSAGFESREHPLLFSWHANLAEEAATLSDEKKFWVATLNGSVWTIKKKSGLLTRMTVGDDALVLDRVVRGNKASPIPPREVCPETTDADTEHEFLSATRRVSALAPYVTLVHHWEELDPQQRAQAVAGFNAWWTQYFADELPVWVEAASEGEWRAELRAQVADSKAYLSFRDELPESERAEAPAAWQNLWFQKVAEAILAQPFNEIAGESVSRLDDMEGFNDAPLRELLLLDPIIEGLTANAEVALTPVLAPVLQEGMVELQKALDTPD